MTLILPMGGQAGLGVGSQFLDEFEKADLRKGLAHWDKMSLKQYVGNGGIAKPLSIRFNRKELGKYSIGFQLYFKFIESLIFFFLITVGPAAYLIYSNYKGNGYTQIRSPFDSLTLGNQPNYTGITLYINTSHAANTTNGGYYAWSSNTLAATMTKQLNIQMYIDLGIAVFFFLFYFYYRYSSNSEKEEIDAYNCNVSDYAIQVDGIPAKGVTELEVATHFGMLFGSVNQCKFARNYQGTMLYFADIAHYQDEKRRQEGKIKLGVSKNTRRVDNLEKRIHRLRTYTSKKLATRFGEKIHTHNDFPAVKGFVLFDTLQAQSRALRTYGKFQSTSIYRMIFCCQGRSIPQKLKLLGKYNIRVSQADEPTNINWENQDAGLLERWLRLWVVSVIVILCWVFTFGFIIASNVLSYSAEIGASCVSTSSATPTTIFTASAANCYCATLSVSQLLKTTSTCGSYIQARSLQIAMSVLSGVCIALINFIIKQIFIALGRFQRYETLSKESGSTNTKYFFSLFINTAIIPILANSSIYGFKLSSRLVDLFVKSDGLVSSTFPSDFDQNWYSQVGAKIMSPMIIAILSPHLINVLTLPCIRCLRTRKAKKMIFQKDLNKLYTPPEFKISFNYGIALNILFVSLTFSAGMPLLYMTAFASYIVITFCEKYIIARNCRKPPGYDNAQNLVMIKFMPFALLVHCALAIWMYGCSTIFPYAPSEITWSQHFKNYSYIDFSNRIQRSLGHAILGAVVLVFILLDTIIWPIFLSNSEKVEQTIASKMEMKRFGTFRQEYKRLTQLGIASYNLKANPGYHDVIEAMQLDIEDDKDPENEESAHRPVLTAKNNVSATEMSGLIQAKGVPTQQISPGFKMQQPPRMSQVAPMRQ